MNRIVTRDCIGLIHVNDLYNLLPPMLHLLGRPVPYVCHVRFMPDRFPPVLFNFWLKLHIRYAEKIIAVSKAVLNQLPQHPKIQLIYDKLPFADAPGLAKSFGRPAEQKVFLYLSNFMKGKGHDLAIAAFALIHQRLPSWRLRFVGSDMGLLKNRQHIRSLRQQASTLGISEKIEWAEFTNDVEREYRHADVVLNFSESESFSKTCLEALFYARPLIASDCGGPAEIIDNGITGILVPNRNINEMANAMIRMASQSETALDMGRKGKIAVEEKFSLTNTTLRLKEIYDDVFQMQSVRS